MGLFTCWTCGEEWQRHPATAVPCTRCKAKVNSPCRRPSGHELMGGDVHIEREQAALDAGLLQKCPGRPAGAELPAATPAIVEPAPVLAVLPQPPLRSQLSLF